MQPFQKARREKQFSISTESWFQSFGVTAVKIRYLAVDSLSHMKLKEIWIFFHNWAWVLKGKLVSWGPQSKTTINVRNNKGALWDSEITYILTFILSMDILAFDSHKKKARKDICSSFQHRKMDGVVQLVISSICHTIFFL